MTEMALEIDLDRQEHRIKFLTCENIPPSSQSEKILYIEQRQEGRCRGCRVQLPKSFSVKALGSGYNKARFCHYTGAFYCHSCMRGPQKQALPSKILYSWDFELYPVCDEAAIYLSSIHDKPLICVSAVNPTLFDRVISLRIARRLRTQLSCIYEACHKMCPTLTALCDRFKNRRYLVEGTEMYSLADLTLQRLCPVAPAGAKALRRGGKEGIEKDNALYRDNDDLVRELKELLEVLIQHVVHHCAKCYAACAKTCPGCKNGKDQVFIFDVVRSIMCRYCEQVYHRNCFKPNTCDCKNTRRAPLDPENLAKYDTHKSPPSMALHVEGERGPLSSDDEEED